LAITLISLRAILRSLASGASLTWLLWDDASSQPMLIFFPQILASHFLLT
jgi:hypothetical protein